MRIRIQRHKNAGIAEVFYGDEQRHAGMAIIVDPWHVITCAHVVNAALGADLAGSVPPLGKVRIGFPMLAEPIAIAASIVEWRSAGERPQDDIAVLKLDEPAPEEAGIAMFADVTGMLPDGDALSVFGIADGDRLGNQVDVTFKGSTSAAWIQIDGLILRDHFIEGGFSGASVWNYPHSAVLGMVVAKNVSEAQRVAYMIPTADLQEVWPQLPVEHRALPPSFARTWTMFSALYFFFLFAHWAVNRGIATLSIATLSGDHKQLASYWGMHIYAFLAPFLLLLLMAFASSFRLHEWKMRVPSFGAMSARPSPSRTRLSAGLSLVAFVVLPLIAQVHFIRNFHQEGYVYVYPGSFGYDSNDPAFKDQKCDRRTVHLCTKEDAGRYSIASPKPGSTADYWGNAYHFGDRDKPNGSVTFWPIFQPVVIIGLSLAAAIMSIYALVLVFRRTPDRAVRKALAP